MKTFLKDCRWGRFLLIDGDMISGYVNALGHWCDIEVDLFRLLLPPENGVCIEVGANIGMHSVPLAKLCPRGAVICYEPQRPIFHVLCANIALNDCLNVTTRHAAVGDSNGRIAIQTGDYDQPWNYGSFSVSTGFSNEGAYAGQTRTERVEIVALDDDPALEGLSRLDLLKIDAEGHEQAVIAGARALIARHRPDVFVEPGKKENVDSLRDAMQALGYRGYWFVGRRFGPDDNAPADMDNTHHDVNLVFRHADAAPLNLQPLVSGEDLTAGIPILIRFGAGAGAEKA